MTGDNQMATPLGGETVTLVRACFCGEILPPVGSARGDSIVCCGCGRPWGVHGGVWAEPCTPGQDVLHAPQALVSVTALYDAAYRSSGVMADGLRAGLRVALGSVCHEGRSPAPMITQARYVALCKLAGVDP